MLFVSTLLRYIIGPIVNLCGAIFVDYAWRTANWRS